MEFNIGNVLSLLTMLVTFAFGYGILNQRVKSIESRMTELDSLRNDIKIIGDNVQYIIGKFDTFIEFYKNEHKD